MGRTLADLIEAARIARTPADGPEPVACWVSQRALDDLHRDGGHVGTKTIIWNAPDSKTSKPRVALYTHPVPADGPADAVSEAEVEAARRAANEFFATVEPIEIRDEHFELPGDQTAKLFRFVLQAAQRARK